MRLKLNLGPSGLDVEFKVGEVEKYKSSTIDDLHQTDILKCWSVEMFPSLKISNNFRLEMLKCWDNGQCSDDKTLPSFTSASAACGEYVRGDQTSACDSDCAAPGRDKVLGMMQEMVKAGDWKTLALLVKSCKTPPWHTIMTWMAWCTYLFFSTSSK